MRVANFSKTEFFFIVFNLWLKIVPFVNADFSIFDFLNFLCSQKIIQEINMKIMLEIYQNY